MIWLAFSAAVSALLLILYHYYPAVRFLRFLRNRETAAYAVTSEDFSEREIQEAGVQVHFYGSEKKAVSTLLMLPGLHPHGIHDPRFKTFAGSCARFGFLVVAPDLPEFRDFKITFHSVEVIEALVKALPHYLSSRPLQRLGILGISYGVGPVLIAATRDTVKAKLNYLISIGGYYDLRHAMEFAWTGIHEANGIRQISRTGPWARMIIANNYLEQLVENADLAAEIRPCLSLRLTLKDSQAEAKERALPAEGKAFLKKVLEGIPPEQLDEFSEILGQSELLDGLSPSSHLSRLSADLRIYLLHGRGDDLVPFAETLEIETALRQQGHCFVRTLITGKLGHADPSEAAGLLDFLHLLGWTHQILSESR